MPLIFVGLTIDQVHYVAIDYLGMQHGFCYEAVFAQSVLSWWCLALKELYIYRLQAFSF